MANFKLGLEAQIQTILSDYVGLNGVYSDPVNYIRRWENRILDFDPNSDLPYVAIMARNKSQLTGTGSHEIGTSRELWNWNVDVYYLDVELKDFSVGYSRQADLTARMTQALENEPRLRSFSMPVNPVNDPGYAHNESVYNNDWLNISWDNSGQEDYWLFVSELHLLVQTERN